METMSSWDTVTSLLSSCSGVVRLAEDLVGVESGTGRAGVDFFFFPFPDPVPVEVGEKENEVFPGLPVLVHLR